MWFEGREYLLNACVKARDGLGLATISLIIPTTNMFKKIEVEIKNKFKFFFKRKKTNNAIAKKIKIGVENIKDKNFAILSKKIFLKDCKKIMLSMSMFISMQSLLMFFQLHLFHGCF